MEFFESLRTLGTGQIILLLVALVIAFGFEVINGFHDTANAVATVIYTKSLMRLLCGRGFKLYRRSCRGNRGCLQHCASLTGRPTCQH